MERPHPSEPPDPVGNDAEPAPPRPEEAGDSIASTASGDSGPLIVALGTSSGGLEALELFFDAIPLSGDVAYVVVQHLLPEARSELPDLLRRHTGLTVRTIEDGVAIRSGEIHVTPPGKNVLLEDGRLRLVEQKRIRGYTPDFPIDLFLRSLAESCGERSVVVILSGSGTDGTLGAAALQTEGGLVLVQDPGTAQFGGMPQSVIASGFADRVLPPDALAHEVSRIARSRLEGMRSGGTHDRLPEILDVLRLHGDVDLEQYRPTTLVRRIDRRVALAGLDHVSDYLAILAESPEEWEVLRRDLLITVTSFFRDPKAWERVAESVIAPLVAGTGEADEIRVWVPACSSGEEAYTVGILLLEAMHARGHRSAVKIFASDVDDSALRRASAGRYPETALAGIPRGSRHRFFRPEGDGTGTVVRELRELVIFSRHDLSRDAPFTRMDLVTCRNALIYRPRRGGVARRRAHDRPDRGLRRLLAHPSAGARRGAAGPHAVDRREWQGNETPAAPIEGRSE